MGAFSGAGGLAVTYLTDLPPGAMIVILSATVVAAAWGVSLLRR
jgi:ABC-type Mn2+/Zn2+ transport system permease subunit